MKLNTKEIIEKLKENFKNFLIEQNYDSSKNNYENLNKIKDLWLDSFYKEIELKKSFNEIERGQINSALKKYALYKLMNEALYVKENKNFRKENKNYGKK